MPEKLNSKYVTFLAMAVESPSQNEAFWDKACQLIQQHGGVARRSNNMLEATFGFDDNNQEEQSLAACLTAQALHGLRSNAFCQIAVDSDYVTAEKDALIDCAPARNVIALCRNIGLGQTALSPNVFDAVKKHALTREIKNQSDRSTTYLLRKIVDRNMPLFYLRHNLNQPGPLVGRDNEFNTIIDYAESSFASQSGHMHIEGDAGSGKTRLLYAVIDHLGDENPRLAILASPSGQLQNLGSNPVQDFLCSVCAQAGFTFKKRSEVRDTFIRVGLTNDLFACAYLDAHGMNGTTSVWAQMTPADHQFFQAELASRIAAHISRSCPLIVLFDDVHKDWGYNQVLLQALRNNFENSKMLVLTISKKPDFLKGNFNKVLKLQQLPRNDVRNIVRSILPSERRLQTYIDEITIRANGNPYFAIQLAQHIKKEAQQTIPESLDSLFASKIDGMEPTLRRVLSSCAVLGQRLSSRPLLAMLDMSQDEILIALQQLEDQGLLHILGADGEVFEFTHDLAQESIYHVLSHQEKRELHQKALRAIRNLHPSYLFDRPSHLTHHAFYGEVYELAYAYGYGAGMNGLERCIPSKAEENLSLALVSLRRLPASPKQESRIANTLLHLARAMALNCKPKESLDVLSKIPVGGYSQFFKDQRTLLETSIKWSTADYTYKEIKEIESSISLHTRMGIGNGLRCAGMLSDLGYFAESNECIQKIYPNLQRIDSKGHFGMLFPAASYCLALMSFNYAELGEFDHAHIYAVSAQEEIEHMFPAKKVYGLAFSAVHYQRQNQHDKALTLLKEAYFLAKEFQIGLIFPFAACNYAYSLYMATKDRTAFSIMRNGLAYAEQRGYYCRWALHNFQYAQMLHAAGHLADATRQAFIALKSAKTRKETHIENAVKAFLTECGVAYDQDQPVVDAQAGQAA